MGEVVGGDRPDLSTCAYYRGVGTCSFGCYGPDGPRCMELGPPTAEVVASWEATDLPHHPYWERPGRG